MRNWADDIANYHQGKLSPAAMNQLEREALNDPLLAEALEGAAIASDDFSADIEQLNARLLKKTGRQAGWWRIAASFVLLAGLGASAWFLWPMEDTVVATQNEKSTFSTADSAQAKKTQMPAETQNDQKTADQTVSGQKKDLRLTQKKTTKGAPDDRVLASDPERNHTDTLARPAMVSEPTPTVAEIPTAQTVPAKEPEVLRDEAPKQLPSTLLPVAQHVTGRVTDDEGNALPGVNVVVMGTTLGTVTDVDGRYELTVPGPQTELVFSFIGFNTQRAAVGDRAELNASLTSDVSQLSEVVVTGYGLRTDATREPVVRLAEPEGGRRAYNKYLDTQVRYPEQAKAHQVKGRVTLQFTVRTDGSLAEFNVLKGLGYGCDEEVIRLVKEGPRWQPTTEDEVPVESAVRIRVKFAPPGR